MNDNLFEYLNKDFKYLANGLREINDTLFSNPHNAIIKGRTFSENLAHEILRLEKAENIASLSQIDRLTRLQNEGLIQGDVLDAFHFIRRVGNKAAHGEVEGELELALGVHKSAYKIACWFVETYVNFEFAAEPYKSPKPSSGSSLDAQMFTELMKKVELLVNKETVNKAQSPDEMIADKNDTDEDLLMDLILEDIVIKNELEKTCLVQELARLKESSKEAVESIRAFSTFKKYMHIERDAQNELEKIIEESAKSENAQLILVCGSVGDGKSHIISYFNNNMPDVMHKFTLHNDATESLEPDKTSMDTLNEILDGFCDSKIDQCKDKLILAINLGTLTNFIDSPYGSRFTKLSEFVHEKKILDTYIVDNGFDSMSSFQFVNFGDFHLFSLKNGVAESNYIKQLVRKITKSSENNIFYNTYKKCCFDCENKSVCPIKMNFELLAYENVQEAIIDVLVQAIVKHKIIISTRAMINFIYEIVVPISYIDINSKMFKSEIANMNMINYISSLLPNLVFGQKDLSYIFETLSLLDPLRIRRESTDDFVIEFTNSEDALEYFEKHIVYPEQFLYKIEAGKTEIDQNVRQELLKLFIRSYYLCGNGDLLSLKDPTYTEFINGLYYWNKGDKGRLKNIYDQVKSGIMKWNGIAEKDQINIFIGKNQTRYKISEDIELKVDTSNLPLNADITLNKFISVLRLKFKNEKLGKSYEIDIDYALYDLLIKVTKGYRPNKRDKNNFVNFIEFINKIEESGSQDLKLVFAEKNRDVNKKYKLEYDTEFEFYRFVEM